MIVNIPDEIFSRCKSQENLNKILIRFCDYDTNEPIIVVNKTQRARLQDIFDAVIQNADELIKKVEKLSQFKIGTQVFTFTPEQLSRLNEMAQFNGKTLKEYISETISAEIGRFLSEV